MDPRYNHSDNAANVDWNVHHLLNQPTKYTFLFYAYCFRIVYFKNSIRTNAFDVHFDPRIM